jgi:hypothetical protein
MILAAETKGLLDDMCASLTSRFKSRVLGEPMYFLGMNVSYDKVTGTVMLNQQTYINSVIEKFQVQIQEDRLNGRDHESHA